MMRRSARSSASVARWLLNSRSFAVSLTLTDNDAIASTRSAVSPVHPLDPIPLRCPFRTPERVGAKTALCWTGAMQLRKFHTAVEEPQAATDFVHEIHGRELKTTEDYNRVMQNLMRIGAHSRILHLFEDMKTRGVTIDNKIYTSIMKTCSKMNKKDMVKQVFDEAVTSGTKPNKFVLTSLISSYADTGDVNGAFEAFYKMKDYDILPDAVAYRSLITVCGKAKDVNRARAIFDEMPKELRNLDARNTNAMLRVYLGNFDSNTGEAYLQECKDLVALTKSEGIEVQAETYVPLIHICGKLGRSDEALSYLKESIGSDVELTQVSFTSVLRSLADIELTDEELEEHIFYCCNRMKELNMKRSRLTYRSIAEVWEKRGDLRKALGFLKKLYEEDRTVSRFNANNICAQLDIIQRLWKNGTYSQQESLTEMIDVVEKMKSVPHLSYRGYKTWFDLCLKASDAEQALECWNHITKGSHQSFARMAAPMIQLMLNHDRVEDAMQVLKVAQKDETIPPRKESYEMLLAYCAGKSDTENAQTVFEYLKEAGVNPDEAIQKHLSALQLM